MRIRDHVSALIKEEAIGDQPGEVYFNWTLRQLIVGPENYEQQSALWGKNHSMVPVMFGRDAHPFTGAGVNLIEIVRNFKDFR